MSTSIIDDDRIQVLHDAKGPTHAVVPWDIWQKIGSALEAGGDADLTDEELFDTAETGGETFPQEVVEQLFAGVHPVKVYRKHRGLTQADLARAIGSAAAYISQIENGRPAGRSTLKMLARALKVDMEDLMPRATQLPKLTRDGDPRWDFDRDAVSIFCLYDDPRTGRGEKAYFRISVEALTVLEPARRLDGQSAIAAYLAHEPRIIEACARALAEGRGKRDGAIPIVMDDFL